MAHDEEEGDERARSGAPLPPDDRVWRHPSELASGATIPAAWIAPAPGPARRPVLALAGACLTGAALTCGLLWLTRPGWVSEGATPAPRAAAPAAATTVASFRTPAVPTAELADDLAPHLVQVEVEAPGATSWTSGTGLRLAGVDAVLVATPLVEGAGFVAVSADGRRRTPVTALGGDPATATTVLALAADGTDLPALVAARAEPGQPAAVIGARSEAGDGRPQQRVVPTSISAVGVRIAIGETVLHDAIELDRALPDDALGAAVVDADGRLLGIVVATTADDGMAVAVPARTALGAASDLADDGAVRRAWLGVEAVDLDPATATMLGLDGGAALTVVAAGSPAERAGLEVGDVITEVDGSAVLDASDLVLAIREGEPGEEVTVRWQRRSAAERASVTLGG